MLETSQHDTEHRSAKKVQFRQAAGIGIAHAGCANVLEGGVVEDILQGAFKRLGRDLSPDLWVSPELSMAKVAFLNSTEPKPPDWPRNPLFLDSLQTLQCCQGCALVGRAPGRWSSSSAWNSRCSDPNLAARHNRTLSLPLPSLFHFFSMPRSLAHSKALAPSIPARCIASVTCRDRLPLPFGGTCSSC